MATEIDAADVLSTYSALLTKTRTEVVRSIEELPYSKDVIKIVLRHCIKLSSPGQQREFLRAAYVSLADFQELSDTERCALAKWDGAVQSSVAVTDSEISREVRSVAASAPMVVSIYRRIENESSELLKELNSESV